MNMVTVQKYSFLSDVRNITQKLHLSSSFFTKNKLKVE